MKFQDYILVVWNGDYKILTSFGLGNKTVYNIRAFEMENYGLIILKVTNLITKTVVKSVMVNFLKKEGRNLRLGEMRGAVCKKNHEILHLHQGKR